MKTVTKILFLCGIIVLTAFSCEKDELKDSSHYAEGYIVGSFRGWTIDENGQETNILTDRGYCILLDGSDNTNSHWPMDFYTFNLPCDIFDFQEGVFLSNCDGNNCGPVFFPDSLRTKYKIKFHYRKASEKEKIDFSCGCLFMMLTFRWDEFNQILLEDITVINRKF